VPRHPALEPLEHHHRHGVLQARRLREAALGTDSDRRAAAAAFLRFYEGVSRGRFREEEELLYPLLVGAGREPPEALARALLDHVRVHALAHGLRDELEAGEVDPQTLDRLGSVLDAHIALEQQVLFPLLEGRGAEAAPPGAAASPG
jgi:hypothetical protein